MRCVCHGAAPSPSEGLRCTSPLQFVKCHPFFRGLSFSVMKTLSHAVDASEIFIVAHILRLFVYLHLARRELRKERTELFVNALINFQCHSCHSIVRNSLSGNPCEQYAIFKSYETVRPCQSHVSSPRLNTTLNYPEIPESCSILTPASPECDDVTCIFGYFFIGGFCLR